MNSVKKAILVSTIILLLFTSAYIIVITQNIPVSSSIGLFNWNPPEKENYIPIILSYPDSSVMIIGGNINDTRNSLCTVKFLLKFNGTLSENTPIEIVNASCLSYANYAISVTVSFPQAIDFSAKSWIGDKDHLIIGWAGTHVVEFQDNRTQDGGVRINSDGISLTKQSTFYFPVAGDYSPIIRVRANDQWLEGQIYTYDAVKIHVIAQSENEQVRINKVNLGLTVALFGFSYIGGLALIYELIKKEKTNEESHFSININIMPETKNKPPTTKEEKTTTLSNVQPYAEESEPNKENKEKRIKPKPKIENNSPKR